MKAKGLTQSVRTPPTSAGWIALAGFVALVALTGGGSRSDISSLPLLRGGAVLIAGYALAIAPVGAWHGLRFPALLLGLLALWIAAQLVPLPPALWASLPGRELVADLDRQLGLVNHWRPISLTPSFTTNSLLALIIPAAALATAVAVPAEERPKIWWLIWGFGMASAAFSLIQFVGGSGSAAYLYRITNEGSLVGLFSNRNHNALLLALAMIAAGWLLRVEFQNPKRRMLALFALFSSTLLFLLIILANGSRLGLISGLVAFVLAFFLYRSGYDRRVGLARRSTKASGRGGPAAMRGQASPVARIAVPIVLIGLLSVAFYFSDRANSLSRLVDEKSSEEVRLQSFATVTDILSTHWAFGSGFGSFSRIFQIVEPDALLRPSYLNHAHNDWLQFPIEGGAPAVILLLAAVYWLISRFFGPTGGTAAAHGNAGVERWTLVVVFGLFAFGSVVDYPLRTPSLAAVAMLFLVLLRDTRGQKT